VIVLNIVHSVGLHSNKGFYNRQNVSTVRYGLKISTEFILPLFYKELKETIERFIRELCITLGVRIAFKKDTE
jgi:hypothetical protein